MTMKDKVLELIKSYILRPDVRADKIAFEALSCLAGDVDVMEGWDEDSKGTTR